MRLKHCALSFLIWNDVEILQNFQGLEDQRSRHGSSRSKSICSAKQFKIKITDKNNQSSKQDFFFD